jgi:hypothetical protein
VNANASVLESAGVQVEREESASASYLFAEGGSDVYPFFRGQLVASYTPEAVDTANLAPFLRFYASFNQPGAVDGLPIMIDLNLTLAGYTAP